MTNKLVKKTSDPVTGVTIIICCYNSANRLPATLEHLKAQIVPEHIPWEVIVVDNASIDQTVEVAKTLWGDVPGVPFKVVSQPTPGLIYARIKGFETAKYEFVSFVDDDNWVAPNWVQVIYEQMTRHPQSGQIGGRSEAVYETDPPLWFTDMPWSFGIGEQAKEDGELPTGAVLWGTGAHRKSAWENLAKRGYTPLLVGRKGKQQLSGEDLELGYSLLLTGWKLYYTNELVFEHFMPTSRFDIKKHQQMRRGYGRSSVFLNMYRRLVDEKLSGKAVTRRAWYKKIADLVMNFLTHPRILFLALSWQGGLDPEVLMMQKHVGSFIERTRLLAKVDKIEEDLSNFFDQTDVASCKSNSCVLDNLKQEPVFFFTGTPIAPGGQGSAMRVYTNLRAYLDLGFRVELIHFADEENQSKPLVLPEGAIHLTQVLRSVRKMNRLVKKMVMRLGFPMEFVLKAIFPDRSQVIAEAKPRFREHPQALFHFEYDNFASAALAFPGMRAVWSNHDLFSQRVQLVWQKRDERISSERSDAERQRAVGRVRQAEDLIARRVGLILNIAAHEHAEFQRRGYGNAVLFPMSWPDEALVPRARAWKEDGKLRLLHLGSVGGLVGYESLSYLIGEVFPRLVPAVLDGLDLWVVGSVADSFYSNRILEIAKPYPQVRFLGFAENLREMYAQADVQVVGGVKASGLRTRIIESMVYGVPVLSTAEMAEGLSGLADGENILLAKDASDFADRLTRLVTSPPDFDQLARSARETYDRIYSRPVAAEVLAKALELFS